MNDTRDLTKRGVALAAAVLLALPAVAVAQGTGMSGHHGTAAGQQGPMGSGHGMMGGMGMMGGGMMGGMGMMMGPTPGFILAQKDALGLTAEQVTRLDSLQAQLTDTWQTHHATMQGVHQEMGELRQAQEPDLDRYQKLMQQMASSGAAMHVRIAKLSQEAERVLTPDQRSKVRYGMSLMGQRGGMGSGGMMGRGSMMGGGMMGSGMMRGSMHGPRGAGTMGPGGMTEPGSTGHGAPCGAGSPAEGR